MPRMSWKTLWTGSITVNGTAALSASAPLYMFVVSNSAAESSRLGCFFVPGGFGGTNTFHIPVMFGATASYIRVQISDLTALKILAVGDAGIYVHQIFGLA